MAFIDLPGRIHPSGYNRGNGIPSDMDDQIAARLLALNQKFYQTFAESFAETRARLQPGVARLLDDLPPEASVLDLGCGSGGVARGLAGRGHRGPYVGLDSSPALIDRARRNAARHPGASFVHADLTAPDWTDAIPGSDFGRVLAFAVLHHLPGVGIRRRVLRQTRRLTAPEGRLALSVWQFLRSPRLRSRVQPWETVGLSPEAVDADDYLLDWRRDGYGLRYVHHFSPQELADLARETGFAVLETFRADGRTGDLGLYQIWAPG